MSLSYAVVEIRRDDLGRAVAHHWYPRISGHLMTEGQAHELWTFYVVAALTANSTSRPIYRVCRWEDAESLKGPIR